MPDLLKLFEEAGKSSVFMGIVLPIILMLLQLMGKFMSHPEIRSLSPTKDQILYCWWFLCEDLHLALCVISISAIFFIASIEASGVTGIPLLLWFLAVIIISSVSCLFTNALSRKNPKPFSVNAFIGMHIPNALGAFTIFMSYNLYASIGGLPK